MNVSRQVIKDNKVSAAGRQRLKPALLRNKAAPYVSAITLPENAYLFIRGKPYKVCPNREPPVMNAAYLDG